MKEGSCYAVVCCEACGEELSRKLEILVPKEHRPSKIVQENIVEESCWEEGRFDEVVYCKDCGAELSRESGAIPKTKHTPGPIERENIMEPTATEPGSYEEVTCCMACHKELSRRIKTIPALGTKEGNKLSKIRQNMHRLFVEEQFPSSLTMSRALGMRNSALRKECLQYAYACNDPAHPTSYCYSELQTVFSDGFGQAVSVDALGVAAHLWLFFSSNAAVESYYLRNMMHSLEQNLMFQRVPELKSVFYDLESCYTRTSRLFGSEVLSMLVDNKRNSSLREQHQKEAQRFLASKPEESQKANRRVDATFRNLFGIKAPLRIAIERVADGNESKADEIWKELSRFLKSGIKMAGICEEEHLDRGSIESFVDGSWISTRDKVARNRNENFRNPARATAINRVMELVKLSLSWISLNSSDTKISDEDRSFLDTQRRKISEEMKEAAINCQASLPEEQAAFHILADTLDQRSYYLLNGCAVNDQKYFYLEFLHDNRIEMDEDYIPFLEDNFEEIATLNLCKRILKHSESQLPDWPDVIKRIFEEPEEHRSGYEVEMSRLQAEKGPWPIFDEVKRLILEQMYSSPGLYGSGSDRTARSTSE